MFTKSQLATAFLVASTVSVQALPYDVSRRSLEAHVDDKFGAGGGCIEPSAGKGKVLQTSEVLPVGQQKETEHRHAAIQPGYAAHVHDTFHESGGPVHATVDYKNDAGDLVTRLHIRKDNTRLSGNQYPPTHASGITAPPNSPVRRAVLEMVRREMEFLEARGKEKFGANGGWIEPSTAGRNVKGKVRQIREVLAVGVHKETEPNHEAVQPGNTAHVHDTFHEVGGLVHATVDYKNEAGDHVTRLDIAKDGTRLSGNKHPPTHAKSPLPPCAGLTGSPWMSSIR